MNKQEFLERLQVVLSGLPREEAQERLNFYAEMIDDRIEEGLSEKEAVLAVGNIDEITAEIAQAIPEKPRCERKFKPWEIVLLILGAPLWLSLLIAAFAVILSLYISLWAAIISLWAVFGALCAGTVGAATSGIGFLCHGHAASGAAMIGTALVCAGLSIFLFFGCRLATHGTVLLTKRVADGVKRCFTKKEAV